MKLILATVTLLLSTALAYEIGQSLKCYGSDGWKNLESVKFEKEQCSYSRCYAATIFDVTEGVTGKFGCDLIDYEEKILAPFIENVQKAEELRGLVSLSIDEQELFARADAGKSTIEKIKSREKLPLNGSMSLKIDGFEYDLDIKGLIDLSNPMGLYRQSIKVCFGKPEICDNITLGNPILAPWFFAPWFLTKLVTQKKARIVFDQFELNLSISGDLGSALNKVLRDETFQADVKLQIDSDESYVRINYHGKTSVVKFMLMIGNISGPYPLEYIYSQATEIFAAVIVDNAKYFRASGCSEDLCNDSKRHFLDIKN